MAAVITQRAEPERTKPSFLGLLNEISEAERRGFDYLTTWADRCSDPEVESVLRTVAAREAEHSASFARRIVELGYRVKSRPDSDEEVRRSGVVGAEMGDRETFEALGYGAPADLDEPDVFDGFFRDHTIDPATGTLLGRFIAEERDSARILRRAYEGLVERTGSAVR